MSNSKPGNEVRSLLSGIPRISSIDDLGKSVAGITVAIYAFGLLCHSFYLAHIGVSDFSLFRSRYILAGLTATFPLLWNVAMLIGFMMWLQDAERMKAAGREYWELVGKAVSLVIVGAVILVLIISFIADLYATISFAESVKIGTILSILAFVVVFGAQMGLVYIAPHEYERLDRMLPPAPSTPSVLKVFPLVAVPSWARAMAAFFSLNFTFLGVILGYTVVFSLSLIPMLPEQLGGALPVSTQLLIASTGKDEIEDLGIEFVEGSSLTTPVLVIWENESSIWLQSSSSPEMTLRISKSEVIGTAKYPRQSPNSSGVSATPVPL